MRLIEWTSEDGYKHLSLVRDEDLDEDAPYGLRQDPPDLDQIDWESFKREIHNQLVEKRLVTWRDVEVKGGLVNLITTIIKRHIIPLYKLEVTSNHNGKQ